MATYKHNTFHFDDLICLGPFNIYATSWVVLWFVADNREDAISGGNVLTLKLDFVMALDDLFICNASLNSISERQIPLT